MNISLLNFIVKMFEFLALIVVSLFSNFKSTIVEYTNVIGTNEVKDVVEYETIYKYNSKLPSNIERVVVEGVDGITYESNGETKVLVEKVDKVIEKGTGKYGEYTGALTEYGPDCYGCDPNGYTYCATKNGTWHSLTKDGIYYEDYEYGKVRILAAYTGEFPCGTIIEINNSEKDGLIGVVLDTGGGMINAYRTGWTLIDLAYESQSSVEMPINKKTSFSVKRWGW